MVVSFGGKTRIEVGPETIGELVRVFEQENNMTSPAVAYRIKID